jgi:hypothetical protein
MIYKIKCGNCNSIFEVTYEFAMSLYEGNKQFKNGRYIGNGNYCCIPCFLKQGIDYGMDIDKIANHMFYRFRDKELVKTSLVAYVL